MIIEVFTPRNVTLRTQKTWEEVEICDAAKLRLMKGQSDFTETFCRNETKASLAKGPVVRGWALGQSAGLLSTESRAPQRCGLLAQGGSI